LNRPLSSWHLLGAGSLGCLFATCLRRAGVAIELIVRDDTALRSLRANGGIALTRGGECTTTAIAACTANTLHARIDRLLVCTKAQQTIAAIDSIQAHLADDALIVLLQNGMGVRERLQQKLPRCTILQALSTEGAFQSARFCVTHAGRGETWIGAVNARDRDSAKSAAQSLQCELPVLFADDIERRLWLKLAVNSVINPLTALHRCRNGELARLDNFAQTVAQLCEELARIARADGVELDATQLCAEVFRVMHATADNKSSMLQDVEAQRATEIDFINGFIVDRARAHALPCAYHAQLLAAVTALQP